MIWEDIGQYHEFLGRTGPAPCLGDATWNILDSTELGMSCFSTSMSSGSSELNLKRGLSHTLLILQFGEDRHDDPDNVNPGYLPWAFPKASASLSEAYTRESIETRCMTRQQKIVFKVP